MPVAYYKGKYYNMPFNMNTFHQVFGVDTPEEAKACIEKEIKAANIKEPKNLEEKAISMVGTTIYEMLVKGYTQKQWGRPCHELPPFIISRLPVRYEYNNNYFNDTYQGIPIGGFTKMVENMLVGIEVKLNVDYLEHQDELNSLADKIIYTGEIDLNAVLTSIIGANIVVLKRESLHIVTIDDVGPTNLLMSHTLVVIASFASAHTNLDTKNAVINRADEIALIHIHHNKLTLLDAIGISSKRIAAGNVADQHSIYICYHNCLIFSTPPIH